jgi:hypothetical protein
MSDTKYVVIDDGLNDVMYIFPNYVTHSDFVKNMGVNREMVISAGFIALEVHFDQWTEKHEFIGFDVYGKSISLDIGCRPEDVKLLNRMFEV